MTQDHNSLVTGSKLRLQAEAQLSQSPPSPAGGRSLQELVHELQVHQIELEMQNEALRQSALALEESHARYLDLYEFAPVGYLTLSAQGTVEQINLTGAALLLYDRRDVLHRSFTQFVQAEDQADWGTAFGQASTAGDICRTELALQRGDGSVIFAQLDCVPVGSLSERSGAGASMRITLTDITKTRRKNDLLVSGVLKSAIFNSTSFCSIATDARGLIQLFNAGAEHMLGYTADEMVNQATPVDFAEPKELLARAQALSTEFKTPIAPGFETLVYRADRSEEDTFELTCVRKDGSCFPAMNSVIALRDTAQVVVGYLLICTDNTARHNARLALQQTEERLNFALKMSHTGGWSMNLADHSAVRTEGHARIFGNASHLDAWSYDIFLGYVVPEDRAEVDRSFRLALAKQSSWDFECRIRREDGEVRWIWASGEYQPDDHGAMPSLAGIVQDITQRKQDEIDRVHLTQTLSDNIAELHIARDSAERANLAKSDFLSSMSHELRTPLGAILGFAQLLDGGSTPLSVSQKKSVDQILKAGWYLLELINEILDLTVIEAGKTNLLMETVSLVDLLRECESMIEPQVKNGAISLVFAKPTEPLFVHADRTRVKQVLVNLLSNAIKYNRVGGAVAVASNVTAANRVRISVRDTGNGLTPAQLGQLFEPFNRLGRKGGAQEGTGIGLVVSKRLVELMNGTIHVDSKAGQGSVFWIELDRVELAPGHLADADDDNAQTQPTPLEGPTRLRTVLLVEDNPANQLLIAEIVSRRSDLRLLCASNGQGGIEMAQRYGPDAILMDMNLPGIGGLEALQRLASHPRTMHIPVIALSANAVPRDIELALEAGFFRYVTKPIVINEFMATLDAALECAKG